MPPLNPRHFYHSIATVADEARTAPDFAYHVSRSIGTFVREFGQCMIPDVRTTSRGGPFGPLKGRSEDYQDPFLETPVGSQEGDAWVVKVPGVRLPVNDNSELDPRGKRRVIAPCYIGKYHYVDSRNKVWSGEIGFASSFREGSEAPASDGSPRPFTFYLEELGDTWTFLAGSTPTLAKWKVEVEYIKGRPTQFQVWFHDPYQAQSRS
ncbi:hypothetical protein JCM5350_001884 [Sporobolomyces pararoseus]